VGQPLVNYNFLSNQILAQNGLSLSNPADVATLLAQVGSPQAGRFQNRLPFPNFPLTATVAQSLRPYPQFNTNCTSTSTSNGPCPVNAPLGDSWYNSLQLTANKRFSHGFQADWAFTWSKSMDTFGGTPDVQNRALAKSISNLDQPLVMRIGFTYSLPNFAGKLGVKPLAWALRDWMFNGFAYYASGTPLISPTANTTGYASNLNLATINNLTFQPNQYQIRTGAPLYLQDLNCHCFDPNTQFVLNPAAWTNPAPGQYGGPAYSNDFRGERRPTENFGIGRQFRIKEKVSLSLRAEFTNILNRTYYNNPTLAGTGISPQTAPTCKLPAGGTGACAPGYLISSGFGAITTSSVLYPPRTGQIVARFEF
jgi:hypothetical protein